MQIEAIETEAAIETRARFTIAARPLADAVKLLSGKVTERRHTFPILSCLLIEAAPCGRVTLTATDLDMWATVTLAADPTEEIEPGAICLDADALAKMLAKVAKNSDRVRIEAQDRCRADLKAGRNVYKLPGLPRDDFPMPKAAELDCAGVIDRAQFLADLKALAPAVSTEETRYYLNGYALQVRHLAGRERFAMVATNGGNIAVASRPIPAGLEGWQDATLPRKLGAVLQAADKVAGEGEGIALSRLGDLLLALEFGAVRIVSKLINGTYPDWRNAFECNAVPTDGNEEALFPDMMPGRPLAAMEGLAKAAPTAIAWAETETAFIGESAGDPGLAWCCMKLTTSNEPRKGFTYGDSISRDHARDYLAALAASKGLPSWESFAEKCRPFNESAFRGSARSLYRIETDGERVLGLTVGAIVRHAERRETVQDWEALCERTVTIPEYEEAMEGSYSILMPADGPVIEPDYSVTVEGDRRYPVAVNSGATQIHLSKEQVAALCGDDLWNVLEFPGADGKPRYVSQWLWDDGATRLLCVGKDGRCPKAGAPREYVTRAEVEAALAGDVAPVMIEAPAPIPAEPVQPSDDSGQFASARQMPEDCAEAVCATHAAPMPESAPVPAPAEAGGAIADDGDPIAAVRARLAEIEALLAALPAQAARPKRTPAHERAIRRAWAERKARRKAQWQAAEWEDAQHRAWSEGVGHKIKRRRAVLKAREAARSARYFIRQSGAHYDRAINAEHEAREALAAREDLQRLLRDAEARLAAAEAENAQLWAEIETLTAPVPALAA